MTIAFRFDLVTAQISTVELPAARFVVSSKPYPIEQVEALAPSASLSGGSLVTGLYVLEPENLTPSMTIDSGSLRTTAQTYSLVPENLTPSMTIDSGQLKVALIQYTNWPFEAIGPSATIDSGTLT